MIQKNLDGVDGGLLFGPPLLEAADDGHQLLVVNLVVALGGVESAVVLGTGRLAAASFVANTRRRILEEVKHAISTQIKTEKFHFGERSYFLKQECIALSAGAEFFLRRSRVVEIS